MNFKMAPNSLFALLLRSPWWISFVLAVAAALVARLVFPKDLELYAVFSGAPFLVIGCIAAWKQLRSPSASRVAQVQAAVGAMPWDQFAGALDDAFRRDGHEVTRLAGPAADFMLAKAGRTTIVSCRRWKVRRIGIEPLRELHAAMQAQEAGAGMLVSLGELTEQASRFAAEHRIALLQAAGLAVLLRGISLPAAPTKAR